MALANFCVLNFFPIKSTHMSLNWTIINISSSPISREKKTTTNCFIYTITCSILEFLCFFFLVIGFYCDSNPQRYFDFSHFVLNLLTFTPFQHTVNKSWVISSCSHEVTRLRTPAVGSITDEEPQLPRLESTTKFTQKPPLLQALSDNKWDRQRYGIRSASMGYRTSLKAICFHEDSRWCLRFANSLYATSIEDQN